MYIRFIITKPKGGGDYKYVRAGVGMYISGKTKLLFDKNDYF